LSLRRHPMAFFRPQMASLGVVPAAGLAKVPHGRRARVAGLVLLRQRPSTAKGITFVTLEDETGTANLVVRQDVWDRFRLICRHAPAWIAHGRLERKESVIHLVVDRLEDLSGRLRTLLRPAQPMRQADQREAAIRRAAAGCWGALDAQRSIKTRSRDFR
jgi:error-prone DNA polymerase